VDVYDGVPTRLTTWLTSIPKISILVFMLTFITISYYIQLNKIPISIKNIVLNLFIDMAFLGRNLINIITNGLQALFSVSSIIGLILGAILGVTQVKIKRLLTFSTINHLGFLVLCLAINSYDSIKGFVLYLIQYTITNIVTFLSLLGFGFMKNKTILSKLFNIQQWYNLPTRSDDIEKIVELKGLNISNLISCILLGLCLFSLAGIPPMFGFYAKMLVLIAGLESGMYFITIICILTSTISAYYYLKLISFMFFNKIIQMNHVINPKLLAVVQIKTSEIMLKLPMFIAHTFSTLQVKNNNTENSIINLEISYLISYIICTFTILIVLSLFSLKIYIDIVEIIIRSYYYV
jgi:NADH-ubiquinone oxidoreductase chain 2